MPIATQCVARYVFGYRKVRSFIYWEAHVEMRRTGVDVYVFSILEEVKKSMMLSYLAYLTRQIFLVTVKTRAT